VRYAPREKKLEQIAQAEKLLCEIEPDRVYTYEYVCYRITHFRPESHVEVTFTGKEISRDLRLFVDDLSDAARMAVSSVSEKVVTIEELAERFNVSTKTISRWRRYGLISRRFLMDGRKRVGFLESAVNRFVAENSDKVRRGSQFSQLTSEERQKIIERARRLARAGGSPAEVVRRIARKTGRSPETIRYTLKQFDAEHREASVFGDSLGPIRMETKLKIWQQFFESFGRFQEGKTHLGSDSGKR
jgi:RNA polymerase primary sigma factor/RNA polymerase sigma factor